MALLHRFFGPCFKNQYISQVRTNSGNSTTHMGHMSRENKQPSPFRQRRTNNLTCVRIEDRSLTGPVCVPFFIQIKYSRPVFRCLPRIYFKSSSIGLHPFSTATSYGRRRRLSSAFLSAPCLRSKRTIVVSHSRAAICRKERPVSTLEGTFAFAPAFRSVSMIPKSAANLKKLTVSNLVYDPSFILNSLPTFSRLNIATLKGVS